MTTGVFFHEKFKGAEWLVIGDKFRNFPRVMDKQLKLPNVTLFEPKTVSEESEYIRSLMTFQLPQPQTDVWRRS